MTIVDFSPACAAEAEELALAAYREERRQVPALPDVDRGLDLAPFAGNGLGVAAFQNGRMAGFLCCTDPFPDAFQATGVKGVFSPMGANAAGGDRKVLAALYREAARKWVRAGAVSHGVCLFAHDLEAQRALYQLGFGLRCVDSIRTAERIFPENRDMYTYSELREEEFPMVYPLEAAMAASFRESPFFMNRPLADQGTFCRELRGNRDRCFAAWRGGELAAYLKLSVQGETFLSGRPDYRHVSGAFCREERRGIFRGLLDFVLGILQQEGVSRLGVDYESLNPAASGFWPQFFQAYTAGVARRVDEKILLDHPARYEPKKQQQHKEV